MKIEKTLNTDTLSYKLNLINTTRALFLLTLFAIVFSTLYSVQYRISCQDKSPGVANQCQLTSSFYGLFHVSTPISQLQSVIVIKSRWSYFHRMPDAYALYNIDLVTDKGPINIAYMPESNREELISVAKRLNDYITNASSTTFDIHSLSSLWDYVTCAFFLLMGLLIWLIGLRLTISFDKAQNRFQLRHAFILFFRTQTFMLDEILGVQLIKKTINRKRPEFRLRFIMRDIPAIQSMTLNYFTEKECEDIVTTINTFMGFDPEPIEIQSSLRPTSGKANAPRLKAYHIYIPVILLALVIRIIVSFYQP